MKHGWFWAAGLTLLIGCGSDDGSTSERDAGEPPGDGASGDGTTGDGSGDGSQDGDTGDGQPGDLDGGVATDAGDPGSRDDGGYDPGPGGAIDLMYTQSEDCNAVIQPTGPLVGGVMSSTFMLITVGTNDGFWMYSLIAPGEPMTGEYVPVENSVEITFHQKIGEETAIWKAVSGKLVIEELGSTFGGGTLMRFEDLAFEVEQEPAVGTFTANGTLKSGAR